MRQLILLLLALPLASPHNSTRQGKFFFFFTPFYYRVPVVTPSACTSDDGRDGVCHTNSRCRALELTPAGSCATTGFCCIASKTCGQTSSSLVTYFRNPPTLPARCTLRIQKVNSTITQLRLDFTLFSLRPPQNGKCTNFLMLSQTDTSVPKICGENSGSHVYVNFDPLCDDHTLQFTFGNTSGFSDQWNIRVTQIPNDSELKAYPGCLMYYPNSVTGTISSFNFGQAIDTDTRQLSPLNYGICIRPLSGYCQIRWTGSDLLMTTDPACQSTYLEIPCSVPDTGVSTSGIDRYCMSTNFPNPTSSCKPYVIYVVTNTDATTDLGTTGFQLNFQQVAC